MNFFLSFLKKKKETPGYKKKKKAHVVVNASTKSDDLTRHTHFSAPLYTCYLCEANHTTKVCCVAAQYYDKKKRNKNERKLKVKNLPIQRKKKKEQRYCKEESCVHPYHKPPCMLWYFCTGFCGR